MNILKIIIICIQMFLMICCYAATPAPYTVVVGDHGTILTSANGSEWTSQQSTTTQSLFSVAYDGQDQFAAVGAGGTVLQSLDQGLTWTTQVTYGMQSEDMIFTNVIFDQSFYALTEIEPNSSSLESHVLATDDVSYIFSFGNSRDVEQPHCYSVAANDNRHYVSVGAQGSIYTTEGYYWENNPWIKQESNTKNDLRNIIFDGKQFISVGDNGTILTSLDGVKWSNHSIDAVPINFHSITFSDNLYVIVGEEGAVLTSPDTITWTTRASGLPPEITLNSIDYNGTQFIAVGSSGTIITSNDGITWVLQESGTKENLNGVIARSLNPKPSTSCKNLLNTHWKGQLNGIYINDLNIFRVNSEVDPGHYEIGAILDYSNYTVGTAGTCSTNQDGSVFIHIENDDYPPQVWGLIAIRMHPDDATINVIKTNLEPNHINTTGTLTIAHI